MIFVYIFKILFVVVIFELFIWPSVMIDLEWVFARSSEFSIFLRVCSSQRSTPFWLFKNGDLLCWVMLMKGTLKSCFLSLLINGVFLTNRGHGCSLKMTRVLTSKVILQILLSLLLIHCQESTQEIWFESLLCLYISFINLFELLLEIKLMILTPLSWHL
jgi:hypothetical protein